MIYHKGPDYKARKPFGYACYPCLKPYKQHSLQFHTTRCVFLGYSNSHKGYKCINSHGQFFTSGHVIFNEDHFPFHDGFLNTKHPLKTLTNNSFISFPLCITGNMSNDSTTTITEEPQDANGDTNQVTHPP